MSMPLTPAGPRATYSTRAARRAAEGVRLAAAAGDADAQTGLAVPARCAWGEAALAFYAGVAAVDVVDAGARPARTAVVEDAGHGGSCVEHVVFSVCSSKQHSPSAQQVI